MSLWRSVDVWTLGVTFTFRRVTSEPLCFFPEKLNSVPSLQLHHLPPSGRSNGWKQTCMQMNSWCWQRRLVSPKLMSQGIVEKKKRPGERVGNQSAGRSFTYSLHPTLMLRRWTGNDRSSRVSAACDITDGSELVWVWTGDTWGCCEASHCFKVKECWV